MFFVWLDLLYLFDFFFFYNCTGKGNVLVFPFIYHFLGRLTESDVSDSSPYIHSKYTDINLFISKFSILSKWKQWINFLFCLLSWGRSQRDPLTSRPSEGKKWKQNLPTLLAANLQIVTTFQELQPQGAVLYLPKTDLRLSCFLCSSCP